MANKPGPVIGNSTHYTGERKLEARTAYLSGTFENMEAISQHLQIPKRTLIRWQYEEKWSDILKAARYDVMDEKERIKDQILKRNADHIKLWELLKHRLMDYLEQPVKKFNAQDHSAIASTIERLQKGQRLADGESGASEKQVSIVYHGLADQLSLQEKESLHNAFGKDEPKKIMKTKKKSKKRPSTKKKSKKK